MIRKIKANWKKKRERERMENALKIFKLSICNRLDNFWRKQYEY